MKAIFPGLPLLDAAGKELGESQANGDTQDAVQGFDALLALVAAQSATAAQQQQPVKPLAPSVGAQAPTTAPNPSCVKAQASAPLELMAPQVDAAMYSIQGALFATALEHAGVTLPAHDELMPLETQALEGALIDAQAPSVVQPSAAQMAPTPDVAQPIVAPAHATSEPASQPALHAAPTDGSSAVAAPLTVAQPQANAPTLPSTPRGEVEQLEAATPAADAAPANAPGKDAPVAEGHAAAQ
ncbi:MAG TPA: hypothetical protein VFZ61_10375, partial [Polyangiales bacterium]